MGQREWTAEELRHIHRSRRLITVSLVPVVATWAMILLELENFWVEFAAAWLCGAVVAGLAYWFHLRKVPTPP